MLKTFARLLRGREHERARATFEERAEFQLLHGNLHVGTLVLVGGIWAFTYTDAFRAQMKQPGGVQPLAVFPAADRSYMSEELWPFFTSRIPPAARPEVAEQVRERGLTKPSPVDLLRIFGQRSIANQFMLIPL